MIRRPPRSTQSRSSAASDVYKRQVGNNSQCGNLPALGDGCSDALAVDCQEQGLTDADVVERFLGDIDPIEQGREGRKDLYIARGDQLGQLREGYGGGGVQLTALIPV